MADEKEQESFEAFKNSFAYGSRTDLNFKFLSHLSARDSADFFRDLLQKLGQCMDDGVFDRVVQHIIEWQARAYAKDGKWSYSEGPFTLPQKSLSDCRLMPPGRGALWIYRGCIVLLRIKAAIQLLSFSGFKAFRLCKGLS